MDAKQFVLDQMGFNVKAFLKALTDTPEDCFNLEPVSGGHAVAWHALHIMDWNRIQVSPSRNDVDGQTFTYLGWEEKEWVKNVFGPSLANVNDGKTRILEVVTLELERGLHEIETISDARLEGNFMTPYGERPILEMLTRQTRHIPYHLGQVKLIALQLEHGQLEHGQLEHGQLEHGQIEHGQLERTGL
jgi:hypothetical protein